jgi:hypothetical protein
MDMRGLSNFIRDVRDATSSREAEQKRVSEELGKIRSKFRDNTGMTPYERKKYVCKLLFVFMLGYEVDFGHMESIELLAGHSMSEKLIGYLAVSVLLHENHPLLMLTTHTMTCDIAKGAELPRTLALSAIANVGNPDMVTSVAHHVADLLRQGTVSIPVRKRALLAALHIFRKRPAALDLGEVGPYVAVLVGSQDFAVSQCACAFAEELLRHNDARPHVLGAKSAALQKLHDIIMGRATPSEYVQYQVPAPWLQVKLLRLLQCFPPPSDPAEADRLSEILKKIVKAADKVVAEVQHQMAFKKGANSNRSNLFVATLVEAVSLAVLWDCDPVLLTHCREALGTLISDKRDPNVKFLGLQLLSRMSFCTSYNFSEHVMVYQSTVVQALHDRDNSVRLRALDLLNAMCDRDNAANIVGELQDYLKVSHVSVREDLVLLIAVLAEKFCAEVAWYVEVLVYLLQEAGQFIPEDVWHRLVHVVVNTPSVQKHAASLLMTALTGSDPAAATPAAAAATTTTATAASGADGATQASGNAAAAAGAGASSASTSAAAAQAAALAAAADRCAEVTVVVGAVLLGEYGYQIALLSGCSPAEQLTALHSKWHHVSDATKATLLHCFAKFYNLYDDAATRERIVKIFAGAKTALDAELQQRATEYHTLVTTCSDDVLLACLEPLPDFDVEATTLVARLRQRQHGTATGDHWAKRAEARDARQMAESAIIKPTHGVTAAALAAEGAAAGAAAHSREWASGGRPGGDAKAATAADTARAMHDIFEAAPATPSAVGAAGAPALAGAAGSAAASVERCTAVALPGLLARRTGRLLHDDGVVTVTVETLDSRAADVRLTLRLTNASPTQRMQALAVQIASAPNGLLLQMQPLATAVVAPGESIAVNFAARAQAPFRGVPTVSVSFAVAAPDAAPGSRPRSWAGAVPLPIALCPTFVEPYRTDDATRFQALWDSLGGDSRGAAEQTQILRDIGGGIAAVERLLGASLRAHCFRPPGSKADTMRFAMGALAMQPGDTVTYASVLVVAQQAPDDTTRFAVAVRSAEAALADAALQRVAEASRGLTGIA